MFLEQRDFLATTAEEHLMLAHTGKHKGSENMVLKYKASENMVLKYKGSKHQSDFFLLFLNTT